MNTLQIRKMALIAAMVLIGSNVFSQIGSTDRHLTESRQAPAGVNDEWRWSRTPNGGYDHVPIRDMRGMPLPWQPVRESDLTWKKRVWREISTLEKQNLAFAYAGDERLSLNLRCYEVCIFALWDRKRKLRSKTYYLSCHG